jgi:GlpG protein
MGPTIPELCQSLKLGWRTWGFGLVLSKGEFSQFLANPTDSKYAAAIQKAEAIAREEAQQRKKMQKNLVKINHGQIKRRPPLTTLLIAICVIVFLMTGLGEGPRDGAAERALQFTAVGPPASQQLINDSIIGRDSLALRLASIRRGEVWRLVTPIFIHYSVLHIVFNMMWLFQFGKMIEHRYGSVSLGLLVLATAAISNFVQCTVPDAIGGSAPGLASGQSMWLITAVGGMSGVVYGLFGFIWIRSIVDRSSGMFVPQSTVMILMAWLFFCMIPTSSGLIGASVANWAHGIGLLVGMAAGYWPAIGKR